MWMTRETWRALQVSCSSLPGHSLCLVCEQRWAEHVAGLRTKKNLITSLFITRVYHGPGPTAADSGWAKEIANTQFDSEREKNQWRRCPGSWWTSHQQKAEQGIATGWFSQSLTLFSLWPWANNGEALGLIRLHSNAMVTRCGAVFWCTFRCCLTFVLNIWLCTIKLHAWSDTAFLGLSNFPY